MCLYTLDKTPKVAEQDITCYKVLVRLDDGKLLSPFICTRVSIGEAIKAKYPNDMPVKAIYSYRVGGEGVHAYSKNEIPKWKIFANRVVAEATIPAGTEYWTDEFNNEIAARQMIIEKILK